MESTSTSPNQTDPSVRPPDVERAGSGNDLVAGIAKLPNSSSEATNGASLARSCANPSPDEMCSQRSMAQLYAPIADALRAVESRINQELQSPHSDVMDVLSHGTQLGGKRMRPAILLLAGDSTGVLCEDHVVLGTVVEMVHTATLVHDDVLDQADTRRHVATINSKWNEHTSILIGDYLFAQSFRLAATLGSTLACQWIGEAARRVCEGELRQVLARDVLDIDEARYLDIINAKTSQLCRVACQLGAQVSGAGKAEVDAVGEYGNALGTAFQIADDYLDLWGNDSKIGKTLGTDIEQGKLTLPLIRLLQVADEAERVRIGQILTGPPESRSESILPILDASDAAEYTLATAERFRDQAIAALQPIADSPARDALVQIAQFSVRRQR